MYKNIEIKKKPYISKLYLEFYRLLLTLIKHIRFILFHKSLLSLYLFFIYNKKPFYFYYRYTFIIFIFVRACHFVLSNLNDKHESYIVLYR